MGGGPLLGWRPGNCRDGTGGQPAAVRQRRLATIPVLARDQCYDHHGARRHDFYRTPSDGPGPLDLLGNDAGLAGVGRGFGSGRTMGPHTAAGIWIGSSGPVACLKHARGFCCKRRIGRSRDRSLPSALVVGRDGGGAGRRVQGSALHVRGDPVGTALVSGPSDQLSRPRGYAVGPRRHGRSHAPVPLDADLCRRVETPGLASSAAVHRVVAHGRDIHQGQWRLDLLVSCGQQPRPDDRLPACGPARCGCGSASI